MGTSSRWAPSATGPAPSTASSPARRRTSARRTLTVASAVEDTVTWTARAPTPHLAPAPQTRTVTTMTGCVTCPPPTTQSTALTVTQESVKEAVLTLTTARPATSVTTTSVRRLPVWRTRSARDTIRSATRTTTTASTVAETVALMTDVVQAVTTVISTVSILLRSVMGTLTSVDAGTTPTVILEISVTPTTTLANHSLTSARRMLTVTLD